tara:strand:+ start:13374 stop:13745 length:372 start_codon:yes stop_codon:yes gene_type:complete
MVIFSDFGKLILRLSLSIMMLTHGLAKINKLFAEEINFSDPIGLGPLNSLILVAFAEFIAPIFIIVGYKTKWFALFPFIAMAVVVFFVHWDDPFGRKEKALLYMFGFLVVFLIGPGKYSLEKE